MPSWMVLDASRQLLLDDYQERSVIVSAVHQKLPTFSAWTGLDNWPLSVMELLHALGSPQHLRSIQHLVRYCFGPSACCFLSSPYMRNSCVRCSHMPMCPAWLLHLLRSFAKSGCYFLYSGIVAREGREHQIIRSNHQHFAAHE